MRGKTWATVFGVVILAVWQLPGCAGGLGSLIPLQTVDFDLVSGLGEFEVQAGQPARKTGAGAFELPDITLGRGTIELDPDVITVIPADSGGAKGAVNLQQTSTLEVRVWIAPAAEVETVCETGEQYGPYEVTLDENYVPISIDPSSVTLTQNTLDLLNVGEFALCIQVVSPIDGTVTIESLTFNLGL